LSGNCCTASAAGTSNITILSTADATQTITAGSGTNDKLILEGGANTLTAATGAKVTGFEQLAVAANVTGTIDMTTVGATIDILETLGNGTIAFSKVTGDTTLNLAVATTSTTVGYADATGSSDTITINLGTAISDTVNFGTVVVKDANAVGLGTVNL